MRRKLFKTGLVGVFSSFAFLKIAYASQTKGAEERPVLLLSYISDNHTEIFGVMGALLLFGVITVRKQQQRSVTE